MHFALEAAAPFGITLRPATDDDLPFLEALYASTRAEELALVGWSPEMRQAFLRQQHTAQHTHYRAHNPHAAWRIIERDGEAIGRLYWRESEADLHIIDISLLPGSRGTGIGEALLRDMAAHAAMDGRGLTIFVEKNNPARTLYARLGFDPVEDHGVYDFMRRPPQSALS
jgi:ribosomal protein S18 acetylase RimI-like enzyme